ncbi:MAG: DNA polymerase III subunit beta [Bacteroidales bacterium]|nr:DNA polymerase III subunit beta [Bacteroidales bacterium]
MEFIISKSELQSQLNAIKGVINSKNTLPILDNFLFTLEGNTLKIEASDLETCMEANIPLENTKGGGSIAIDAKKIIDWISATTADIPLTFKIDLTNNQLNIDGPGIEFKTVGVNGDEFPKTQPLTDAKSFTIAAESLKKGLTSTAFATAEDGIKPTLTGILFELTSEHLRFVATDSHKLARYTRTDVKSDSEASFIFPKKPATILRNILAKEKGDVQVEFDAQQVVITIGQFVLNCRLIDGKYPNYAAVIPSENPNTLFINKIDFHQKLRQVACCSDASQLTRFDLSPNILTISATNMENQSSGKATITCRYEGEDMAIGFKSKLLLNIIENIESEEISIEMSDPARAGLIIPVDKEDENEDVLMLLMPMMI